MKIHCFTPATQAENALVFSDSGSYKRFPIIAWQLRNGENTIAYGAPILAVDTPPNLIAIESGSRYIYQRVRYRDQKSLKKALK